ncbi:MULTISPECIES: hypothetical protein [unclassified Moorena]|nr:MULTISPECIES: hypothetical protein [unclassified Moorena]
MAYGQSRSVTKGQSLLAWPTANPAAALLEHRISVVFSARDK